MKIELMSHLMTLLGLARSQGVDLQPNSQEPLKFDKTKGSPELHQKIYDEFNDRVSTQADFIGFSRRDFLKTPMALTAAAAAVSTGLGLALWPTVASASISGPGDYSFLCFGNPVVPDLNPTEPELPASELHGKIAIVVGGSRGMGEQAALRLKARGFHVIGTSRDPSQYGPKGFNLWKLDISKPWQILRFAKRVKRELGHVNLVLANAGRLFIGRPAQSSRVKMRLAMETLIDGHISLLQKLIPLMPDGDDDYARVIFTSSVANDSIVGFPAPGGPLAGLVLSSLLSPYSEAKARVSRFGIALAQEQQNIDASVAGTIEYPGTRKNLKVSVIHPTLIATDLVASPDRVIWGEDPNQKFLQEVFGSLSFLTAMGGLPKAYAGTAFEQMAVLENPYLYTILADLTLQPDGTGGLADLQFGFLLGIALSQAATLSSTLPPPAF